LSRRDRFVDLAHQQQQPVEHASSVSAIRLAGRILTPSRIASR
jgi:hypothetical protein